jgi:hypothetical protein
VRVHLRKTEVGHRRGLEGAQDQTLLFAVVAVTDRHRVEQFRLFAERVEINRHAERRARLVLARVTAANRTAVVVKHIHPRTQQVADFLRLLHQLRLVLQQRQHADLDRRDARMKFHHHGRLAFALVVGLGDFGIGVGDERENQTVHARARLDDVRDVLALRQAVRVVGRLLLDLLRRFSGLAHFVR